MTEFNLSKKRIIYSNASGRKIIRYEEENVKEFIKLLKEEFTGAIISNCKKNSKSVLSQFNYRIDKLAGEDLK